MLCAAVGAGRQALSRRCCRVGRKRRSTVVHIPPVSIERLCIAAWVLGALSCFRATRVLPTGCSTLSTHLWSVGTEQPRIAVTLHKAHFIVREIWVRTGPGGVLI